MKHYQRVLLDDITFPEHIFEIRKVMPEWIQLTDHQIQTLWESYSETRAAAWITPTRGDLEDFREWALREI